MKLLLAAGDNEVGKLLHNYLCKDYDIITSTRNISNLGDNQIYLDFEKPDTLSTVALENIDAVIYLAHSYSNQAITNKLMVNNLIYALTKNSINKLIYISSTMLTSVKKLDKETIPYINSKKIVEDLIMKSSLKYLVLRLPCIKTNSLELYIQSIYTFIETEKSTIVK